MKLRNKKTGEIIIFAGTEIHDGRVFFRLEDERGIFKREINSLAELNEEWKDYEEPKKFWEIDSYGRIQELEKPADSIINPFWKKRLEIGNYFETKEEAEKAVEKLRAWKRLEDKGFKWRYYAMGDGDKFRAYFSIKDGADIGADLDLLFGGEE